MEFLKFIFLLVSFLIYSACSQHSKDDVFGKYVNTYEKDAEHYVVLNPDSTFFHYYKKEGKEAYINEGSFELRAGSLLINGWDELGKCVYYNTERNIGDKNILMEITIDYSDKELEFDFVYPDASPKEVNFRKIE